MLIQTLESYLDDAGIKQEQIAIACSAGADSLALTEAFYQVYDPSKLCVLHFDHQMRADSKLSLEFLQNYCQERNLELELGYAKSVLKSEDDARKSRYQFFSEACQNKSIKLLFLAHNLDDNAETLLFRLFRGTSSFGLQAIGTMTKRDGLELHRPFLKISKQEILAFCDQHSLAYIEDSSNTNEKFARNRIRLKILPEAKKINSKVIENINTLTNIIKEEQAFICEQVDATLTKLGDLPWDLAQFRRLSPMLQRKSLEKKFTTSIAFVDDFLDAIKRGGFHRINFSKAKFFTIKQKQIWLESTIMDGDDINDESF